MALTVIKLGGGLARELGDQMLRRVCDRIARLGAEHSLLIVPGGGDFAHAVRDHDRRYGLSAAASHHMALLAMDQFGTLLAELIPGARTCADPAGAMAAAGRPGVAVLAPVARALDGGTLPRSWQVTSDSIAVSVAGAAGARRVVLLKAVDGLYRDWPARRDLCAQLTADQLDALQRQGGGAGVDRHLPVALRSAGVEAWVISGAAPARLAELLAHGSTVGTRLTS